MEKFEERMVSEWQELNNFKMVVTERAKKLNNFINENEKFKELDDEQKVLMQEQLYAMTNSVKMLELYKDKLTNRCLINRINPVNGEKF